jgi:hypothetical protein
LLVQQSTEFPACTKIGGSDELRAKLFACSGSPDSMRYQEATKFRAVPDMDWTEARVALNRLMADVRNYSSRYRVTNLQYVALAEFALTASSFEGFVGKKSDNAVKLRKEFDCAIGLCGTRLGAVLQKATDAAAVLAHPITNRLRGEDWHGNVVLWASVPTSADEWTKIIDATPDQVIAALDYLRTTLAIWSDHHRPADGVLGRLLGRSDLPSASEYAEAVHAAEMLAFTGEKLVTLYAGIMHSMPIYRLYPATPECEATELWWPWGRSTPLVDGGPAKAPRTRKRGVDPAIIMATRPQDVVGEVMERTGINRTTVQRMTAGLRAGMRIERRSEALKLLRRGKTRVEVARLVGLSPSRISAMFKGQTFPTKRALFNSVGIDTDRGDDYEDHHD